MSYILDALQRADQERNLGEVPKLDVALQPALAAQRRSRLPGILAMLVIAAAVGAGGWLYQQGRLQGMAQGTGADSEPASLASAPVAPQRAPTPARPAAVAPAPEPKPEHRAETRPAPAADTVPPEAAEPVASLVAAEPPGPETVEPAETVPTQAEPRTEPPPAAQAKPRPRLPTPTVAPAPPPNWVNEQKQAQRVERHQAAAALTSYLGMPQSFRNSLPALNMNAHVFSTNPQRGFVLINNKRYRIGDYLAEGPELVDILPDGAVLKYRGQSFLLPVQR